MNALTLPAIIERLVIAAFVLALAAPLVATITTDEAEDAFEENREPAPLPAWPHDQDSLAAWPDAFTKYFADHFAFRSQLVRWQARFRVQALHSSTYARRHPRQERLAVLRHGRRRRGLLGQPAVHRGRARGVARHAAAHTGLAAAAGHRLRLRGGARTSTWSTRSSCRTASTRDCSHSRAEQLLDHLRAHSTVRVADLRPPVVSARDAGRLFHVTDTHWNDLGAFVAYREVIEQLGNPGGPPATFDDFDRQQVMRPGLDLARMLGLKSVLEEEDLRLEPRTPRRARVIEPARASRALMDARVVTEQPGTRPRAVIFRDSFGSAMIPFLSEHFSRAVYVWQNDFDPALVLAGAPARGDPGVGWPPSAHGGPLRRRRRLARGAPAVAAHWAGARRTVSSNARERRAARAAAAAPRNAPRPQPGRTVW